MTDEPNALLDELAIDAATSASTVPKDVRIVFDRSGCSSKRGAWVDGETPQRVGQFLLWETGELDAQILRRADEVLVLNEHRVIESPAEVREALRTFVEILAYVDLRD